MTQELEQGDTIVMSISSILCQHCNKVCALVMARLTYIGGADDARGKFNVFKFEMPFRCPTCLGLVDMIGIHEDVEVEGGWNSGQLFQDTNNMN